MKCNIRDSIVNVSAIVCTILTVVIYYYRIIINNYNFQVEINLIPTVDYLMGFNDTGLKTESLELLFSSSFKPYKNTFKPKLITINIFKSIQ